LKSKESKEILDRFHEYRAQVENLIGKKIKILRSDNGGDYTYKDFSDLCVEARIKRE
jgi:transposase InsO family protein